MAIGWLTAVISFSRSSGSICCVYHTALDRCHSWKKNPLAVSMFARCKAARMCKGCDGLFSGSERLGIQLLFPVSQYISIPKKKASTPSCIMIRGCIKEAPWSTIFMYPRWCLWRQGTSVYSKVHPCTLGYNEASMATVVTDKLIFSCKYTRNYMLYHYTAMQLLPAPKT